MYAEQVTGKNLVRAPALNEMWLVLDLLPDHLPLVALQGWHSSPIAPSKGCGQ